MKCQSCEKEIVPDSFFCTWCNDFIPASGKGSKANLFARWMALFIDSFIAIILWVIGIIVFGSISRELGIIAAISFPLIYLIWSISLFRKGQTPGKKLMGLQVVDHQTGKIPGFGKMLLREIVGKFASSLFFGIGYFWAIFDKNAQGWHDKIAGTVVIKEAKNKPRKISTTT